MIKKILPYLIFIALTLAVMLPLYKPGFIFLLDMTFTPHLDLSDYIQDGRIPSHFPIIMLIKLTGFILPMDIIQKIILSLLLLLPAIFMYQLSKKWLGNAWATFAGVLYMLNPWVYERFLAGHWLVLLGYAFLPLLLKLFQDLIVTKNKKSFIKFGILFALYPIFSIHFAYISIFLLVTQSIIYYWHNKKTITTRELVNAIQAGIILLIVTIIVNSFWLLYFFKTGTTYAAITAQDFAGFQTVSSGSWGVFDNVMALYGFWNNDYVLPKEIFPYWKFITTAILLLSGIGAYRAWRAKNTLGLTVTLLFVPMLIISAGVAHNFSKPIIEFLYAYFPGFKGLRETAKLTSLVALSYALLAPLGGKWIADTLAPFVAIPTRITKLTILIICLLLPITSTVTMFNGFDNQLQPTYYPASWIQANQQLNTDNATKVLVLPWWGYVRLPFAQNNLVSNPAKRFFDTPVLAGNNFDNQYLKQAPTDLDTIIVELVDGKVNIDDTIPYFKSQDISHIVLLQEADTAHYQFLNQSKNLKRVLVTSDLVLFTLP